MKLGARLTLRFIKKQHEGDFLRRASCPLLDERLHQINRRARISLGKTPPDDEGHAATHRPWTLHAMGHLQSHVVHFSKRLRQIRRERFGEDAAGLARLLGVPLETWKNYEKGVSMPAEILLKLIDVTGASPRWLLTGDGDCFAVSFYARLTGNH
jgi:DNA-binding transcriptional regulator YiaG